MCLKEATLYIFWTSEQNDVTARSQKNKTEIENAKMQFIYCPNGAYLDLSVVKLDGDEIRKGLSCDISRHDGPGKYNSDVENLRRVIEVCFILNSSKCFSICSFVSPYKSWRQTVRERHKERGIPYFEVSSLIMKHLSFNLSQ